MADMSDIENAITGEAIMQGSNQGHMEPTDESLTKEEMCVGEFVIGVFRDGFYPGERLEVQGIEGNNITIDFIKPVVLKQDQEVLV